jgi:hypothetical protein
MHNNKILYDLYLVVFYKKNILQVRLFISYYIIINHCLGKLDVEFPQ